MTHFGLFSYNGIFLTEYAKEKIDVVRAKTLVDVKSENTSNKSMIKKEAYSSNTIDSLLENYSSLEITAKYYVDDSSDLQERVDLYMGTEFKNLLKTNSYSPFAQMTVHYVYVDDAILDYMEEVNTSFGSDPANYICPFSEPFTYHTDEDGKLILQTHSFAELPASVNGGIGASFREDCELIFDYQGKIRFWQSSLGLYTSTPTGTSKEGYIFEASFNWASK